MGEWNDSDRIISVQAGSFNCNLENMVDKCYLFIIHKDSMGQY